MLMVVLSCPHWASEFAIPAGSALCLLGTLAQNAIAGEQHLFPCAVVRPASDSESCCNLVLSPLNFWVGTCERDVTSNSSASAHVRLCSRFGLRPAAHAQMGCMLSREYLLHARTGLWLERVLLEERKNQRDAKYHLQRQQQLQLRRQRQQDSAAHEASRAAAEERRIEGKRENRPRKRPPTVPPMRCRQGARHLGADAMARCKRLWLAHSLAR